MGFRTQFGLLLCARICDPLAYACIFPFVNRQMEWLLPNAPKASIGRYSGATEAVFALGQFASMYYFGVASDRFGRKPFMLISLFTLGLFTTLYGAASTFTAALWMRSLNGLLSGNHAILRAALGEMTNRSNSGMAYAVYSMNFDVAMIFAPALGGFLVEPAKQFPRSIFARLQVFRDRPFLLPCLVVGCVCVVSFLLNLFFFQETLPAKVHKKTEPAATPTEEEPLLGSSASITHPPNVHTVASLLRNAGIRHVLFASFSCVFISLSYDSVFVLYAYSSVDLGGLGLNSRAIALCLTFRAAYSIFVSVFLFARLQRWFGSQTMYRFYVCIYPAAFAMLPLMHFLARNSPEGTYVHDGQLTAHLWPLMAITMVIYATGDLMFPMQMIAVNANVPSPQVLGQVNGLSVSLGALSRAIGPCAINYIYSSAVSAGQPYLVWIYIITLTVFLGYQSFFVDFKEHR